MNQQEGSDYGYLIVFLLYTIEFAGFVVGYLVIKRSTTIKLVKTTSLPSIFAWMILLVSFAIYLPVLLKFSQYLISPREIYVRTRTGYGLNYFGSLFFANLSFLVFLFSRRMSFFFKILFFVILFFVLGMHGSKGAFVTIFFIYLMYLAYIKNIDQSLSKTFYYVLVFSVLMVSLFYFTLPETMKVDFFKSMVNYSDYTRHAVMVVDDPPDVQYGKLLFEDNVISLIPRAIYPQKPKDFGSFYLSKYYFPEWFYGDTGSPAFGVGTYFADFREGSLIVMLFISICIGMLTKIFVNRAVKYKSSSDFIMLMFFAGVPLLNLGAGYLLIPHLIVTLLFVLIAAIFSGKMYVKT
ncbi:MAG: hypothetical protein KIT62_14555 [Cyclobacteriaceae bacterium]|nr:hypothetical protein [Cyclobacteriaceae bacterium]